MHRLLAGVMVMCLFSGCIAEEPVSIDSGEALFDAALDSGDAWDLQRILGGEEAYKLEIMDTVAGVQSLVILGEDKDTELTRVAMLTVSGNESIDFEILEGGENYHVRIGQMWYLGRDAAPDPINPLAGSGVTMDGSGIPSAQAGLPMDVNEFKSLDWRVTWDLESEQMVAVTNNDTSSIILELRGMPPVLVKAESYGQDGETSTIMTISTGSDAKLAIPGEAPIRMPVPVSGEVMMDIVDGVRIWEYTVADGFRWEVLANEVELHVVERDSEGNLSVLVEFAVEAGHLDYTDQDGDAWSFDFYDNDNDGLLSGGDVLRVETNSERDFDAAIYDLWAEDYPESFLPAPFFSSLLAFIILPLFRKIRIRELFDYLVILR